MNLLYCHDNTYFYSETGDVYSQGQFPYSYFTTFLKEFDELAIVGRGAPLNHNLDLNKLNLSSGDRVDFALMPNINSINGLLKNYSQVNKKLKKLVEEADAVVIRAVSDLSWLVFKHAKKMNKPIAMEMAACAWDSTWNHGELKGYLYAPIRFLRDKIITANVDYVIYVSQNFLQNRYPTNAVTTIASNVRLSRPDDLVLESRLQKIESKDLDEDILTIGLIGPLGHKIKGIHIALQALSHIEKDKPGKFIFKVLGPGNPENYRIMASELGIEHCVIFEGIIRSGDGVLKWLDDIDIYIQPSFQEGVPRATIEAMSRGCPCLGSMAGGIPELLDNKRLHKPGDIKTLKTHLEKMLTSKENQLEAAKYNFKKVSRYYSDELTPIREKFWGEFKDFAAEKVSIKNSGVKNGARNTTISKTLVAK